MLQTKLDKNLLRTTDNYIKALEKAGFTKVEDLINHFPRDYEDRTNVLDNFSLLNIKEKNTVLVTLVSLENQKTTNNKMLTKAVFEDKNSFMSEWIWFNQKFLASKLVNFKWRKLIISGKVKYAFWKITFQSPEVETDLSKVSWEIVPIYSDINYIPWTWIFSKMDLLKKFISSHHPKLTQPHPTLSLEERGSSNLAKTIAPFSSESVDTLPENIIKKYNFISREEAIHKIHFPKNKLDIEQAKYRLWYEELFDINYKAISAKYESFWKSEGKSISIKMNPEFVKEILAKLPFSLTNNQKIVLFQVLKDMEKTHSMQRLLEWDVWTWKTVVAQVVAIHAIKESTLSSHPLPPLLSEEREKEPSPQPSPLEEREKEPSPQPSPLEERGKEPSPQPSPLEEREKEPSPQPSPLEEREYTRNSIRKIDIKSPWYIFELAKEFRQNPTKWEDLLWLHLKNNWFEWFKFRRQHPIWRYIADFYCEELRLVIELDWKIHDNIIQMEYDKERDNLLKNYWFKIIRLKNEEIIENSKDFIYLRIKETLSCPPLLQRRGVRGEGIVWKVRIGGFQIAIMAPTEILARQHFEWMYNLFFEFWISCELLVWSTTAKNKKIIKEKLKVWNLDVIIWTHALVQENVFFQNLWLVIIDEQHRFWVKQREVLEKWLLNLSWIIPHSLNMTATPIPRTLALTLYWDQDLSIINEYPVWRKKIFTKVISNDEQRGQVELFIRNELEKGRQVFWISPLVEESEKIDLANAINTFDSLVNIFHPFKVWLLHWKMKAKEKECTMWEFSENKIQILSSTSVVEVWVNVPNATIMCIEWAERFWLSQLHQFRWRVWRWDVQSYCYLFPSKWQKTDRLKAMEQTNNWFELAEIDLELRWPWEVYGLRQSWIPDLKVADLRDLELISEIRQDIEELFNIKK